MKKKIATKEKGNSLIISLLLVVVMSSLAYLFQSYSSIANNRLKITRAKAIMTSVEANIRELSIQPSTYQNCNSSIGSSSCQLISTPNPFTPFALIPVPGATCPPGTSCGIVVDQISFNGSTRTFTARIRYTGKDFTLKDININEQVPMDALQSQSFDCASRNPATPLFAGFDAQSKAICRGLTSCPSGQYIDAVDPSTLTVTCQTIANTTKGCTSTNEFISSYSWNGADSVNTSCTSRKDPYTIPQWWSGSVVTSGPPVTPTSPSCNLVTAPSAPCPQVAGQFGIPADATVGTANFNKNTCTGVLTYTGGCSTVATSPIATLTGGGASSGSGSSCPALNSVPGFCASMCNPPTPGNAIGCCCESCGVCAQANPVCTLVKAPEADAPCSSLAGQFGIPKTDTGGTAHFNRDTCTNALSYAGGCGISMCPYIAQLPVPCSTYAGQYGIPAQNTVGNALWSIESCTGTIIYQGGCSAPGAPLATPPAGSSINANVCSEIYQTPVDCSSFAGQYGIPAGATSGQASWTKNSCTQQITYLGGCSAPNGGTLTGPNCSDISQPQVPCASYAGQFGIPADATLGDALWSKNSCTGQITYNGGCYAPAPTTTTTTAPTTTTSPTITTPPAPTTPSTPVCTEVPQPPVACSSYAGSYGIPAGAKSGNASWTQNSCTGQITYTGGCN